MNLPRPTYILDGMTINAPEIVAKVRDALPSPCTCSYCGGRVDLVNNAVIYGKAYGWPLTYRCHDCKAKVGCHPGTDIPLGTLADAATQKARMAAHQAFDPIWKGKGPQARSRAYRALARAMNQPAAHISWFNRDDCEKVVELCRAGRITL